MTQDNPAAPKAANGSRSPTLHKALAEGLLTVHGAQWNLAPWQHARVRRACRVGERLLVRTHPAVQACQRLGLAEDFLYR